MSDDDFEPTVPSDAPYAAAEPRWRSAVRVWVAPVVVSALALAASLAVSILVAVPAARLFGVFPPSSADGRLPASAFVLAATATDAGLLAVALLIRSLRGAPLVLAIPRGTVRACAGALGAVVALNTAGSMAIRWLGEPYTGLPDVATPLEAAAVLAAAGVLAPFAEEIFFREALLARLFADSPRAFAIGATSILFGLTHGSSGGIVLVTTLSAMGCVFAWLRLRTGSLGAPILVHAANNVLALVLALAGAE